MATERDENLLHELGQYHLGIRPLMALRHFAGKEKALDSVLTRLLEQNLVRAHKNCLPHGHSIYQLTKAAAVARGFSEARAQKIGPRALPEHLSVLWFCCAYTGIRRARLEEPQVERLLGHKLPGIHCVELSFTAARHPINRLYRVFVPGPMADDAYTLKKLQSTLEEVRQLRERQHAPFAPAEWLAERRYALAVLVDNEERRRRVLELVKRAGYLEETHVLVERSVSPETLNQTLQEEFHVQHQSTTVAALPLFPPEERNGSGVSLLSAATPSPARTGENAGHGTGLAGK